MIPSLQERNMHEGGKYFLIMLCKSGRWILSLMVFPQPRAASAHIFSGNFMNRNHIFLLIIAVWLVATGGCEDSLNGREASWLVGHVGDWSGRDWICVAIFVWLLPALNRFFGKYNKLAIILTAIAFILLHKVSYSFGLFVKEFDPGIAKPHWLVWIGTQILPGVVIGYLLRFRILK